MNLVSQTIRQKIKINGKDQNFILTSQEQGKLYKLIKRKWNNLIERQFMNEGEAIDGKRTGYIPWEPLKVPDKFDEDVFYYRRKSYQGEKYMVQFAGRPLLNLSYPQLKTRYKRNIRIKGTRNGLYTISIEYPDLISGQGRNAEPGTAIIHQEGVKRRGIPARKLSIESFKSTAKQTAKEYLTVDMIKRSIKSNIPYFLQKNKQEIPF